MRRGMCRSAVFQMLHEGASVTIYVDLPSSFPEDQPCLTLQVMTHSWLLKDSSTCPATHLIAVSTCAYDLSSMHAAAEDANLKHLTASGRLQISGDDAAEVSYQQYPWSPRWEAKEMAKRIYSFLKEQVIKLHGERG